MCLKMQHFEKLLIPSEYDSQLESRVKKRDFFLILNGCDSDQKCDDVDI